MDTGKLCPKRRLVTAVVRPAIAHNRTLGHGVSHARKGQARCQSRRPATVLRDGVYGPRFGDSVRFRAAAEVQRPNQFPSRCLKKATQLLEHGIVDYGFEGTGYYLCHRAVPGIVCGVSSNPHHTVHPECSHQLQIERCRLRLNRPGLATEEISYPRPQELR